MKSLIAIAVLSLSLAQVAMADDLRRVDICGVPTLPYGCDADVCMLKFETNYGEYDLSADSDSLITTRSLIAMARAGGVQCFHGYELGRTFKVVDYAE